MDMCRGLLDHDQMPTSENVPTQGDWEGYEHETFDGIWWPTSDHNQEEQSKERLKHVCEYAANKSFIWNFASATGHVKTKR